MIELVTSETMTVYKVCKIVMIEGKATYHSAMAHLQYCNIQYTIGQKTQPDIKGSKIFVFNSLKTAQVFTNRSQTAIFRGTVKSVYSVYCIPDEWKSITRFWNNPKTYMDAFLLDGDKFGCSGIMEAPLGTLLCDTLTLEEQVA